MKEVKMNPVFVEYTPKQKDMEHGVIYISKKYQTASHLCACGCGKLTVTPLGPEWWTLTEDNGVISLDPSIGNQQLPCKSHYWIKNNIAYLD